MMMERFTIGFKGIAQKNERTGEAGNRGAGEKKNFLQPRSPLLRLSVSRFQKVSQTSAFRNVLAFLAFLLLLANCGGSKPARFYMLTPIPDNGSDLSPTVEKQDMSIGIGPVVFPDYLMRPQIVTYLNPNEIHYAEFDRWAESLADNFTRTIAENLSKLIPTDQIAVFPWRATTPVQYQVTFEVIRFELEANKQVSLKVRWSILQYDESELLVRKISNLGQEYQIIDNKIDYAALAAVMSGLVKELSHEIAEQIRSI